MPEKKSGDSLFIGLILVGVGALMLLSYVLRRLGLPWLSWGMLWPLFLLIPVGAMAAALRSGKEDYGVLIPMTLLTFYCLYFMWLNFTGWENTAVTWPNFLIGPGLGFLAAYIASRQRGFLIPAGVLLGLAAVFYGFLLGNTIIVGGLLVAGGVALVFLRDRRKQD